MLVKGSNIITNCSNLSRLNCETTAIITNTITTSFSPSSPSSSQNIRSRLIVSSESKSFKTIRTLWQKQQQEFVDHPQHQQKQTSSSNHFSICKLFISLIITLLIIFVFCSPLFFSYYFIIPSTIYKFLLKIFIIIYLYFQSKRTLFLFSYSKSLRINNNTINNKTSSHQNHHHNHHHNHNPHYRPRISIVVLILLIFAMISVCSSLTSSSSSSLSLSLPSSSSQSSFPSSGQSDKHSRKRNDQYSEILTIEQIKQVESLFLRRILSLDSTPRPAKHHKVPEYMLHLYRWFQEGGGGGRGEEEEEEEQQQNYLEDFSDVNNGAGERLLNSLFGLTTEDLNEVTSRDNLVELNSHHRVPRRRRSIKPSRVSLNGPSSTVISHKTDTGHSKSGDVNISSSYIRGHLRFDVSLPGEESLTGAELRLYRNSLDHKFHQTNHNHKTSSDSHPSKVNENSSGDLNGSIKDSFMERVNIYHLLRPLPDDPSWLTDDNRQLNRKLLEFSKLIDTQIIDMREAGWLSFDILPAVDWWLKHPTENYGLMVTISDVYGRNESTNSHLFALDADDFKNTSNLKVQSTSQQSKENDNHNNNCNNDNISDHHQWHEVQPLIITFSNDMHSRNHNLINREKFLNRSKRDRKRGMSGGQRSRNAYSNNNKKKGSHKNSARRREFCRRHQMYVDFKHFGWSDWILAPAGYQAFYCKGECSYPMSQHVNNTNHAIIQSLVNSVNPEVVPEPCCVPTDLSPITLLYMDQDGKVVLKSYPNMIVEGCGCS